MKLPDVIHKSDAKQLVCPWRADQLFNHGATLADSEPMRIGREIHALVAQVRQGESSPAEALKNASTQEVADLVRAVLQDDPLGNKGKVEITVRCDKNGNYIPEGSDTPAVVAGTLDLLVPPDPDDWTRTNKVIVEDIKTGRVRAWDWFEVFLYVWFGVQWARANGFEVLSAHFSYHWARFGARDTRFVAHGQIDGLWPWIMDQIDQFRKLEPVPNPGHHCQYCQFLAAGCPLRSGAELVALPDAIEPSSQTSLPRLLGEFLRTGEMSAESRPLIGFGIAALDAAVSELKGRLKSWVIERGETVSTGDTEWYVAEEDHGVWDHEYALGILQAHNVEEIGRVMHVTKTGLGRIKKGYPEAHAAVWDGAYTAKEPKRVLRQRKVAPAALTADEGGAI